MNEPEQSETKRYSGRSASFRSPMRDEQDIQAVAERIAQYLGGAMRDDSISGVEVHLREVEDVPEDES